MAAVCHEYKIGPADYWRLTVAEHRALVDHVETMAKRQRQEA